MDNLNDILKDRVIKEVHAEENTILIHLKPKKQPLPKSWEEFSEMFPTIKAVECYVGANSGIIEGSVGRCRKEYDKNLLPDRTTAEAILALCQLIQLRNCYNGDWIPDWKLNTDKYCIDYRENKITTPTYWRTSTWLYFKTEELRDEFLRNFRPLIEKLKPLYGIKEGGEK